MLEFEDEVYDNVHGFVDVTKAEKCIIDSMFFLRLRDVKQLGFAYYVFPGAVHTRYAHSLGVLWVINQIIGIINQSSPELIQHARVLRMAALLHDIGHYPFSHTLEQVYMDFEKERNLKNISQEYFEPLPSDSVKANEYNNQIDQNSHNSDMYNHEYLSSYIIKNTDYPGGITHILKKHNFSIEDIEEIANCITGKSKYSWFNQLIHSELDADRCDYLLRDAKATGSKYGYYDFQFLIRNLEFKKLDSIEESIITVKPKATFTLEHYLLARYFWYAQIIYNRTIIIYDHIASIIYKHLLESNLVYTHSKLKELITSEPDRFIRFNDTYFWNKLYEYADNCASENNTYAELINILIQRQHFKKIELPMGKEFRINKDSIEGCLSDKTSDIKNSIDEIYSCIAEYLDKKGIDKIWVVKLPKTVSITRSYPEICPADRNKITELDDEPLRLSGEGDSGWELLIDSSSTTMKVLCKYELYLPRIYIKRELYDEVQKLVENKFKID